MNKTQKRRLYYICFFIAGLAVVASLVFYALRQNMNVFLTPHELASMQLKPDYHIRLGGMVKKQSIKRSNKDLDVEFIVTDFKNDIAVKFTGILPDLFREGKGVVAEGTIDAQGMFHATQILAKHDENYMPKKVYKNFQSRAQRKRKFLLFPRASQAETSHA